MRPTARRWGLGAAAAVSVTLAGGCLSLFSPDEFDLTNCTIDRGLLFSGGVVPDGIPALDFPKLASVHTADFVAGSDRVLGVVSNGVPRAYPLFIMRWHEIVNDTLGGRPLAVTYCPLTGSGLVFDPAVGDKIRRFRVSGLLFENNLVMFDRQTESLWNQLSLGGVCGADAGAELARLPLVETTWREWTRLHPTTTVLTTDTGHKRDYGVNPYEGYDRPNNRFTLTRSSPWDPIRPPKELVLGVHAPDDAKAYPFPLLAERGAAAALNDAVDGRPILVLWHGAEQTAVAFHRLVGGRTLSFGVSDTAAFLFRDEETGTTWDGAGRAVSGALAGSLLTPVEDAYVVFWFSWSVYHPNTRILESLADTAQ